MNIVAFETMRLPSIDILRILTVVLIVYRHTYSASAALIASVGVPFFFFLTGWLWRPSSRTLTGEISHRWRTLGIPYLSWLVLLYPVFVAAFLIRDKLTADLAVSPLLGGSYAFGPFTTFWFISALIVVAVLMRGLDEMHPIALAVIAFGLLAVGGYWGQELSTIPLGIGVAIPSLSFAIFGRLLNQLSSHNAGRIVAIVLLPIAALATIPFAAINLKHGDFGTPIVSGVLVTLIIWGLLVALNALFRQAPSVAGRISSWLGPVTSVAIVVVLTHPVLLWVLQFVNPEPSAPIWVFLVALVLPWIAALLIRKTKLAGFLIGQRKPIFQFDRKISPAHNADENITAK